MFKRTVFSLLALMFMASCADSLRTSTQKTDLNLDQKAGVFGGVDAGDGSKLSKSVLSLIISTPGEYYYSHGMKLQHFNLYQCSAVALSPRVILTAAHCWSSDPASTHTIEIENGDGTYQSIKVKNKKIHEAYRLGITSFDIALMQLSSDLPADTIISELPLFKNQLEPLYVNVAGFGKNVGTKSSSAGTGSLRIATLKVLDYKSDMSRFRTDQRGGKGFCQGDSGGPAFGYLKGKAYVVGVISMTSGREKTENIHRNICDEYGILVKTDANLVWIQKYLKIMSAGEALQPNFLERLLE